MTEDEKRQIVDLRSRGLGYKRIGAVMGISNNTVRSFCRRHGLDGTKHILCKQCGKVIKVIEKQKPRKFCSDQCRRDWWNSHLDQVDRKAIYSYSCLNCGQEFTAYGNNHRKYCSRSCYNSARIGRKLNE